MSQKSRHSQFVNVILQDDKGNILLSGGRKVAANERDDDSIYIVAPQDDDHSLEISLQLKEAEDFLELVIPLVSDSKERPFGGTLYVSTITGDSGARLEFTVESPEDYVAQVIIFEGRKLDGGAKFDVDRGALERFLYAVLEGICDDMEDDD